MSVQRFRSVAEMPPPWRPRNDPENLACVAQMLAACRQTWPRPTPGVRRFRTVAEANAERGDPYRSERPDLIGT